MLSEAGEMKQAELVWERAEEVIERIADHCEQTSALSELGEVLSKAGKRKEAELVWEKLEEIIGMIENSEDRILALKVLGMALSMVVPKVKTISEQK
jgi:tetratricopeptide (TPR) repeat protein